MTTTPLTPEQIRAVIHAHETSKQRRRYLAIRSVVRFAFWTAVIIGALALLGHFDLLPDDYRDTCEALGQVCGG